MQDESDRRSPSFPLANKPTVSLVVLGYGRELYLEACLSSVGRELRECDQLLLVDNGIANRHQRTSLWPGPTELVGDGRNLGFAGGCNYAAARARGDVLVFVNSDAILRPGAVSALVEAVHGDRVGLVCGCLRLASQPDIVNSAGNPLHYLGITWAGGYGESAEDHIQPGSVAVVTGGLFAIRRAVWEELGGFDDTYFAYHEDADLSVRCWLSGREVRYVPSAVADHHYEFSRHPEKLYLVERNRLFMVLTDYPSPLLRRVLPMLLFTEPALLALAITQGWARKKLRSWWWLLRHTATIRARRREVQAAVREPAEVLAAVMVSKFANLPGAAPPALRTINRVSHAYSSRVIRSLGGEDDGERSRGSDAKGRPALDGSATASSAYTARLTRLESMGWKRLLDVQRPYRWNLDRLRLGRVLDIGCGIGRNLVSLDPRSVGVDHNGSSVEAARARGLTAYTPIEFQESQDAVIGGYDAVLVAHVLEHVDESVGDSLLNGYLPYLKPGGRVVLITPQERGFRSDSSHVRFVDDSGLEGHAGRLGLEIERKYSFPLPRAAGRIFAYNEFVLVARLPPARQQPA